MMVDHRIDPYPEVCAELFPDSLHICTYDVRGTVVRTGVPRRPGRVHRLSARYTIELP